MAKVIDINKKVSVRKKDENPAAAGPPKPVANAKESFISRFIDIMISDILHKFGRGPAMDEERLRREKYEQFERLARGER
jgi:hypothetical protein